MNILGIGNDIVDIRRIEKLYAAHGDQFLNRFFNEDEKAQLNEFQIQYKEERKFMQKIANTWAAKESVIKAYKGELGMTDVSILRDANGAPYVVLKTACDDIVHISISDEYPYSIAYCIRSGKN